MLLDPGGTFMVGVPATDLLVPFALLGSVPFLPGLGLAKGFNHLRHSAVAHIYAVDAGRCSSGVRRREYSSNSWKGCWKTVLNHLWEICG